MIGFQAKRRCAYEFEPVILVGRGCGTELSEATRDAD
jgi:hypothetical protein